MKKIKNVFFAVVILVMGAAFSASADDTSLLGRSLNAYEVQEFYKQYGRMITDQELDVLNAVYEQYHDNFVQYLPRNISFEQAKQDLLFAKNILKNDLERLSYWDVLWRPDEFFSLPSAALLSIYTYMINQEILETIKYRVGLAYPQGAIDTRDIKNFNEQRERALRLLGEFNPFVNYNKSEVKEYVQKRAAQSGLLTDGYYPVAGKILVSAIAITAAIAGFGTLKNIKEKNRRTWQLKHGISNTKHMLELLEKIQ